MDETEQFKQRVTDFVKKEFEPITEIKRIFEDYFGEPHVDCTTYLGYAFNEDNIIKNLCDQHKFFIDYFYRGLVKVETIALESWVSIRLNESEFPAIITVWFPETTITNEEEGSHVIKDLYFKIEVNKDGSIRDNITVGKSTFTYEEYCLGYIHSHASSINFETLGLIGSTKFKDICKGSTQTPINNTVQGLLFGCNYDLWALFCLQLDQYRSVESLDGIPYIKIGELLPNNRSIVPINFKIPIKSYISSMYLNTLEDGIFNINDFIKYLYHNLLDIRLSSINGAFEFALSNDDLLLLFSKYFIEYVNSNRNPQTAYLVTEEALIVHKIMIRATMFKNRLCVYGGTGRSTESAFLINDKHYVLTNFKGKDIIINILIPECKPGDSNPLLLLSPTLFTLIKHYLITIINYEYYRKETYIKETRLKEIPFCF